MDQKSPDFLIIFFSILTMLCVAIIGIALLSGCSISFDREEGQVSGDKVNKTTFNITTKI